jgi:hypothetical protein
MSTAHRPQAMLAAVTLLLAAAGATAVGAASRDSTQAAGNTLGFHRSMPDGTITLTCGEFHSETVQMDTWEEAHYVHGFDVNLPAGGTLRARLGTDAQGCCSWTAQLIDNSAVVDSDSVFAPNSWTRWIEGTIPDGAAWFGTDEYTSCACSTFPIWSYWEFEAVCTATNTPTPTRAPTRTPTPTATPTESSSPPLAKLGIGKTLLEPAGGTARIGDTIRFRIDLENTGPVDIASSPLVDVYSGACLRFTGANPPPDNPDVTQSRLLWYDLGRLDVGQSLQVTVGFEAIAACRPVVNRAGVNTAQDVYGRPIEAVLAEASLVILPGEACPDRDDDGPEEAQDLGSEDATRSAFFCCGNDDIEDWYRFSAWEGTEVDIWLRQLPADYDLWLRDEGGRLLGSSTEAGLAAEHVWWAAEQSASYYIVVTRRSSDQCDSSVPYELRLETTHCVDAYADPGSLDSSRELALSMGSPPDTTGWFCCGNRDFEDWYQFDMDVGETLELRLEELPADYDLSLYDQSGNHLDSSTQRGLGDDVISQMATYDGTHYAVVHRRDGLQCDSSAPYRLRLERSAAPECTDPHYYDDTPQRAIVLEGFPTEAEGFFCCFNDDMDDWYRLEALEGDRISAYLRVPADYDLELYDSELGLLQPSALIGTQPESIEHTAPTAGTYYLRVFRSSNTRCSWDQPYVLDVDVFTPPPCLDTRFDDDSQSRASWLSPPQYQGYFCCESEDPEDWFWFRAQRGDVIELRLDSLPANYDMEVYDRRGELVDHARRPGTMAEVIQFRAMDSGNYDVRVYRETINDCDSLSPYQLTLLQTTPACPDPFEKNDSRASAWSISPGTTEAHICCGWRDSDWYRFEADEGDWIEAGLRSLSADYDLYLVDKDGRTLVPSLNGGTESERFGAKARYDGTYYLRVDGWREIDCDSEDPYELDLEIRSCDLQSPVLTPIENSDCDGSYTLSWNAVPGATGYDVISSTDPRFVTYSYLDVGDGRQRAFSNQPAGSHYYAVRAKDDGGCKSAWSTAAGVSVAPMPRRPYLYPIHNGDGGGNYLVEWPDVIEADYYELWEDASPRFDNPQKSTITDKPPSSLRFVEVSGKGPGTYYYNVRACTCRGCGMWSGWRSTVVLQPARDFEVLGIEITQAVQNLYNDVPLVAGKQTVVRLFGRLNVGPAANVEALLFGWRDGQPLPGSPLSDDYGSLYYLSTSRIIRRQVFNSGWRFSLPTSWTQPGTVTLRGVIDPKGTFRDVDPQNNLLEATRRFTETGAPCIVLHKVLTDQGTVAFSDPSVTAALQYLEAVYPVDHVTKYSGKVLTEIDWCWDWKTFWKDWIPCDTGAPYELPDDKWFILLNLRARQLESSYSCAGNVHHYGMVHPNAWSSGYGARDIALVPGQLWGRVATGAMYGGDLICSDDASPCTAQRLPAWSAPVGGVTMAHELGHNYGRKHVDCGGPDDVDGSYPYAPCALGPSDFSGLDLGAYYGTDLRSQSVIEPTQAADIMSYSFSHRPPLGKWISDYTYKTIFDGLPGAMTVTSAPSVAEQENLEAEELLMVSGWIDEVTGNGEIIEARRMRQALVNAAAAAEAAPQVTGAGASQYVAHQLDAKGGVLKHTPFELIQYLDEQPDVDTFFFVVPFEADTRDIVLYRGDIEFARRTVSPSAPTVQLLTPNGGEVVNAELYIAWEAQDADWDSTFYTVQYSPDAGASWVTLVSEWLGDELLVDDLSEIAGSEQALVRVVASDGLNTGSDTSDGTFTLARKPPQATILTPEEGAHYAASDVVRLWGQAWDAEENYLPSDHLHWAVDGVYVGSAEQLVVQGLAPGPHEVEMTAVDSDPDSSTTHVSIQVDELQIPWRVEPIMDGSCNDEPYDGAAAVRLSPYADGTRAEVRVLRTPEHLWACVSNLQSGSEPTASVRLHLDPDGSGEPWAQRDDVELGVEESGNIWTGYGDGYGGYIRDEESLAGFLARVFASEESWSAELRVDSALLGEPGHSSRLSFGNYWVNFPMDDYVWPTAAGWSSPPDWALAQANPQLSERLFMPLIRSQTTLDVMPEPVPTAVLTQIFVLSDQMLGTSFTWDVTLQDADGDGDPDAFAGNINGEGARLWLNDGAALFKDDQDADLGAGFSTRAVALGDLDGDGHDDIFIVNGWGDPGLVLWNRAGVYVDSGQRLGVGNSTSAALGDLDGDGDLDAYVGNWGEPDEVWFNDGSGLFTGGPMVGSARTEHMALGDVDGDGDLDAVCGQEYEPNAVWLNDGHGGFSESRPLGKANSRGVALGDLDGDGDLDVFLGNGYRVTEAWGPEPNEVWLNDGTGHFSDSGQRLGFSDSGRVALGDLDGDDDLDATVANYGTGVEVWLNTGDATFMPAQQIGNWPSDDVALADLDGDGDLDAVVGNNDGQPNRVLINQTRGPEERVSLSVGETWVPAWSSVTLFSRWAADTVPLVQDYLGALHLSVSIDGLPMLDAMSHWGAVGEYLDFDEDGDMDYSAIWTYPLGVLRPGEHQVSSVWTLGETITDGFDLDADGEPDEYSGSWDRSVSIVVGDASDDIADAQFRALDQPSDPLQVQLPAAERDQPPGTPVAERGWNGEDFHP